MELVKYCRYILKRYFYPIEPIINQENIIYMWTHCENGTSLTECVRVLANYSGLGSNSEEGEGGW